MFTIPESIASSAKGNSLVRQISITVSLPRVRYSQSLLVALHACIVLPERFDCNLIHVLVVFCYLWLYTSRLMLVLLTANNLKGKAAGSCWSWTRFPPVFL